MKQLFKPLSILFLVSQTFSSCQQNENDKTKELVKSINLKRGDVIVCGPAEKKFGSTAFITSCSEKIKNDFDLGIALLHSFEYDEAEKVFAKVIDAEPGCAMAYWGVAMSNYHLLWTPPSMEELKKGARAIEIAASFDGQSKKETEYIHAAGELYRDFEKRDHMTRCLDYEKAMEKIYLQYPDDKEAAILYALALNASADPADNSFRNQRKAAGILDGLYPGQPDHPGVIHYIIHTYDNPEMAEQALPAARRYASVAPSSAHALHMPSHIFTRTGLWDESIRSNMEAATSARCYAEQSGIKGNWDEELHCLDYLMYAYLQKGDNTHAKEQLAYLKSIGQVNPMNFKVPYSFAAIPSRYVLENKLWKEAATLNVTPANFDWKDFPWQNAIIHFTRLLGSVNSGDLAAAREELKVLNAIHGTLLQQKDLYKANQVLIQIKAGESWILFREGKNAGAIKLMTEAADMEDATQKHPVTPGEVLPARELLADMLLQMNKPGEALKAYEQDLKKRPNRLNAVYGAALAAERAKNHEKARYYYGHLIQFTQPGRNEIEKARQYLGAGNQKI